MEVLKSFCSNLITQMETELLNIRLEHPETLGWAKHSIPCVKKYLDELRHYIVQHPFKKRSEEIYFFKEVKPVVMGKMVFMCEVHNKEAFRPIVDLAKTKDYLADEMDEIEAFFNRNKDLYDYYKDTLESLDIKFFVRKVEDRLNFRDLPIDINPVFFYGDPVFSTGFDYLFAQFRGYELLKDHLENELEALFLVGDEVPPEQIKFTGNEADFVEMVNIFKNVGNPVNPETGEPATDEELFQVLKKMLNPNLPDDIDFNTLKLTSGSSDLPERMIDSLENLRKKWDEEEDDIDYTGSDEDKPKE